MDDYATDRLLLAENTRHDNYTSPDLTVVSTRPERPSGPPAFDTQLLFLSQLRGFSPIIQHVLKRVDFDSTIDIEAGITITHGP